MLRSEVLMRKSLLPYSRKGLLVCVLAGALALAIALVAAKDVSAAPSPALAGGATQISGDAVLDELDTCDSASEGADYALLMHGDFEGCLYRPRH